MPNQTAPVPEWKRLLRESNGEGISPESAKSVAASSDATIGNIAALSCLPEIHDRSFRRGMVLCAAGETDFTAALYWRGRIFGLYRHTVSTRGVEGVLLDLKEFRLGWMPDETVRETGGCGSALTDLPPEAEGFPLACFTGANSGLFAGHGKMYTE